MDYCEVGWSNHGAWKAWNRTLNVSTPAAPDRESAWALLFAAMGSPFECARYRRAFPVLQLVGRHSSGAFTSDVARAIYGKPGRKPKRDTPGMHADKYLRVLAQVGLVDHVLWRGGCRKWKLTHRGRVALDVGERWRSTRTQSKTAQTAA